MLAWHDVLVSSNATPAKRPARPGKPSAPSANNILQRIETHPTSLVGELTPRRWKEAFAGNPLRSDLHRVTGNAVR
jgi:hypothetical protein